MKKTQKERVVEYLQSHKRGVTALDGFTKFNPPITQMHTIVHHLRADGFKINCKNVTNKNTGARFARWTIDNG